MLPITHSTYFGWPKIEKDAGTDDVPESVAVFVRTPRLYAPLDIFICVRAAAERAHKQVRRIERIKDGTERMHKMAACQFPLSAAGSGGPAIGRFASRRRRNCCPSAVGAAGTRSDILHVLVKPREMYSSTLQIAFSNKRL